MNKINLLKLAKSLTGETQITRLIANAEQIREYISDEFKKSENKEDTKLNIPYISDDFIKMFQAHGTSVSSIPVQMYNEAYVNMCHENALNNVLLDKNKQKIIKNFIDTSNIGCIFSKDSKNVSFTSIALLIDDAIHTNKNIIIVDTDKNIQKTFKILADYGMKSDLIVTRNDSITRIIGEHSNGNMIEARIAVVTYNEIHQFLHNFKDETFLIDTIFLNNVDYISYAMVDDILDIIYKFSGVRNIITNMKIDDVTQLENLNSQSFISKFMEKFINVKKIFVSI